jgi:GDP-L-fucose synthase
MHKKITMGFKGALLLEVSRLKALGWQASIGLEVGLRNAYAWFLANQDRFRQ